MPKVVGKDREERQRGNKLVQMMWCLTMSECKSIYSCSNGHTQKQGEKPADSNHTLSDNFSERC